MFKSFALIALSTTLIFSMLAPAIFNVFDIAIESVVLVDTSEEESQKTSEKEVAEKDIVIHNFYKVELYLFAENDIQHIGYLENASTPSSKILLPPPEQFI